MTASATSERGFVGVALASLSTSAEELVAGLLGLEDAVLTRHCPRCGASDHGRPLLAGGGAQVSLSSSAGLRLVAVSTLGPVGVDVQRVEEPRLREAAPVFLHAEDGHAALAVTWSRKEALLKAAGVGLSMPMSSVAVAGSPPRVVVWPDRLVPHPWVRDLAVADGYVASVAGLGPAPEEIRAGRAAPR